MEAKQLDLALEYFYKRATLGGNPEEIFCSKLAAAKILELMNKDPKVVEAGFLDAYHFRPHRIEPLYYMIRRFRKAGNYQKAYDTACCALELPTKPNDYMCVEKWVYDYGILLEMSIAAAYTGHYAEGLSACEKLFALEDLPEGVKKDAESCFEYISERNVERVQKKLLALFPEVRPLNSAGATQIGLSSDLSPRPAH